MEYNYLSALLIKIIITIISFHYSNNIRLVLLLSVNIIFNILKKKLCWNPMHNLRVLIVLLGYVIHLYTLCLLYEFSY